MTTPQPQQESQVKGGESETFKTPELTPEQDARFDSAYIGDIYLSNDVDLLDETSVREDLKAHLATELELQRREYEDKYKKAVKTLDDLMLFIPDNNQDLSVFRDAKKLVIEAHVILSNPITLYWAKLWEKEIAEAEALLQKETI